MPTSKSDDHGRAKSQGELLYVSIVCAVDGARFAAVAASEPECLAQVASYVAEQAAGQLHPPSACRVRELLTAGDPLEAVAEYFRHAGERWEAEWLVTASLHPDSGSTAWSGSVPLPALVPGWHKPPVGDRSAPRLELARLAWGWR